MITSIPMKLHQKAVEEIGSWLFLYLLILETSTIAIYLCILLLTGKAFHPLDLEGINTIPSFLQAFQLFLIGAIALFLFKFQPPSSDRPSRLFLLTMAVLLFYAAIDEVFKLHLQVYHWFPILQPRDEMERIFFLLFATPTLFYRDFRALWQLYRRETLLIFLGMGILILGQLSSELIKFELLQPLLLIFFVQQDAMLMFVEKLKLALEVLAMMVGESVILYGVLLFFAKRVKTLDKI